MSGIVMYDCPVCGQPGCVVGPADLAAPTIVAACPYRDSIMPREHEAALVEARPLRIYVASSWRCPTQPAVVEALRAAGHDVYDFRNPPGKTGFGWHKVNPGYAGGPVTPETYPPMVHNAIARAGFREDMGALESCDACVLVLPCGRSAHLEAGIAIGQGKPVCILLSEAFEPELMYLAADTCTGRLDEVVRWANLLANPGDILDRVLRGGAGAGSSTPADGVETESAPGAATPKEVPR